MGILKAKGKTIPNDFTKNTIHKKAKVEKKLFKPKYLAIILKETHGSIWRFVKPKNSNFSIDGHTYFSHSDGSYDSGELRFAVYLEGVSVPLHHGFLEKESKEVTYKEQLTGLTKKATVQLIKGLKTDSVINDILLNRGLAAEFTKKHVDMPSLMIIILLLLTFIIGIISAYGSFT